MVAPILPQSTEKTAPPNPELHPGAMAELQAVLVAQLDQSPKDSHSLIDSGEEITSFDFPRHCQALITAHGGTMIGESANTIAGCFRDGKDALKAAIALLHLTETTNEETNSKANHRVKLGIDYGEILRDGENIHGPALDMAVRLKNLAGPGEIYTSSPVVNLCRTLSSVHFEVARIRSKNHVQQEFEVYKAVWDKIHETGAIVYPIMYVRPIRKLWNDGFATVWDELLRTGRSLWKDSIVEEITLRDTSIILIPKQLESVIPLARSVALFLRRKVGSSSSFAIPIAIVADVGPYGTTWKPDEVNVPHHWHLVNPGYLYITEKAFNLMRQTFGISENLMRHRYGGHTFYQVALEEEPLSKTRVRFLYREAMAQGPYLPCFYCGDRKHQPVDCPSKNIPEITNALDQLGYLSTDELNSVFYSYLLGEPTSKTEQGGIDLLTEGSLGLAACAFFELKRIFQLRFLRSFWNTTNEEWNKARNSRNQGEGGLIWLAQDSLRVSELTKAESMLASALNKYPLDYRVYVTYGFLSIEKNNLSRAEHYFSEALDTAKTSVQRVFVLLLLSRLHWISGNQARAADRVHQALALNVESVDAAYQDVILKFFQGKERPACQRLTRLVQQDRAFFITALIDPDLAPFSKPIEETLEILLERAKKEAESAATDARNEFDLSRVALTANTIDGIKELQTQIDRLMDQKAYCAYLDVIDLSNRIVSTCRSGTIQRKREIWEILHELNKRFESNMTFLSSYPYQSLVSSLREELLRGRDKIHQVQNIGPALSQEQLIACHRLHEELTRDWDRLESRLRSLDTLFKFSRNTLRFLRWSGVFIAVIWFLGLFLFPLIIYYLNAFLSGFDTSTIPNVWFYQKKFLLFGSLLGITASLCIVIKGYLRGK